MKQVLIPSIFVSSALLLSPALFASPQNYPQRDYNRDRAYERAPGVSDFRSSQSMFAGVRSDLDRAENNLPEFSGSRYSFDRVRGELSELQRQWDESAYEPSQADKVVRTLDRALATSDLSYRDRDRLTTDLNELRDFRDSHE